MGAVPPAARKFLLGLGLLVGLMLLAALSRGAPSLGSAELWLGLAAVGVGCATWFGRGAKRSDSWVEPALEVRARTGLTPRCGLALIEADGQSFLVVHGEGFATVHGMAAQRAQAPTPRGELLQ